MNGLVLCHRLLELQLEFVDFQDHDIEALEFIKCFRSAGVSVDSLVDYMSLYQKGMKRERKGLVF